MKVLPRFEKRRKIKIKFLVLKSLSESYIRKKNFWHFAALSGLELHIQKHFPIYNPSVASVLTWQMFNLHSFLGSISKEENKLHLDSFFLMPPPPITILTPPSLESTTIYPTYPPPTLQQPHLIILYLEWLSVTQYNPVWKT